MQMSDKEAETARAIIQGSLDRNGEPVYVLGCPRHVFQWLCDNGMTPGVMIHPEHGNIPTMQVFNFDAARKAVSH